MVDSNRLSGVTGFVGAFLLHELLSSTKAHVHCLIRASSNDMATKRLQDTLKSYYLDERCDLSRVTAFSGDCSAPLFGLFQDDYNDLSAHVSTIYHAAAEVNHVLPYSSLRKSNVVATHEVLKFAAHGSKKVLNFVSTLGTVVSVDAQLDPEMVNRLGGYNATKLVSERLLMRARARGFVVNIFRPGNLRIW